MSGRSSVIQARTSACRARMPFTFHVAIFKGSTSRVGSRYSARRTSCNREVGETEEGVLFCKEASVFDAIGRATSVAVAGPALSGKPRSAQAGAASGLAGEVRGPGRDPDIVHPLAGG